MPALYDNIAYPTRRALTAVGEGVGRLRGSTASSVAAAVEQQQPAAA